MKEIQKNSEVVSFLEKVFAALNKDKFGGELEMPIITVQSTPGTLGHCTCGRVWRNGHHQDEKGQYEISIGAEYLDRMVCYVVATMLHEMVHLYHLQNGIQDTSRGNAYHNKRFKEKAEEVGLIIEYDKRIGWSVTKPSQELSDYVCAHRWQEVPLCRISPPAAAGKKVKKPSSTRKYECPACGLSVRATRDVRIICAECSEIMEKCE